MAGVGFLGGINPARGAMISEMTTGAEVRSLDVGRGRV